MAIYTNLVQEFRDEIEARLTLDDVIDTLIAEKHIDDKLYAEIWTQHQSVFQSRVNYLINVIIKDAKRCERFINLLGTIPHLKGISDEIKTNIDKICRMIVTGGFPEFSLNYVVRNSVANTIKDTALDLNPKVCSTLVVHGLPGFGKSCLVNQVLQTKRFWEVSDGAMFWINLGEHEDTTTLINPLWNLYLTAIKFTQQVGLVHRPEDIIVLQNEVKRLFLDDHLANCYIILDDVKSSEVLDIFKLRCKIIVTTQDKNIAKAFDAYFIKVTTGFTKKESLELLRKSLDTDNLCSKENYVTKIHELCDGCPMLLNIIGSILKDSREEALSTDVIWNSIIQEIVKNNYLPHPITTKVIQMIRRFVNLLNPEVQKCLHSLAVFPKHVNIRPEILMKLWDKTYYAVRQVMVELENKSLIVSFYNKDLKTYIYSIHSLVRTYLVERADPDIKLYHQKLISEYEEAISAAPPDDPIANYIFGYYGYHAKSAGLDDKFENYFDLTFMENKIKRVGSADLLTDFETYKDLITKKDPKLERRLDDYIKFVNSYSGHLHISPETNIVQFAFFNDNNCVFEDARILASNNPDQLYFKLQPYSGRHKNFPTLKTRHTAVSTCFLDSKEVLVGTLSGSIEVKSYHQYQHKVQRFEGHADQVFSLQLSPDGKSFLSISRDHTAKLWRFIEELDPQSPKLKQSNWKNLHSPDENIQPHKTFKMQDNDYITSAAFPYDGTNEIVTASKNGKITRWNIKTASVVRESASLGLPIAHISYVHDSQQIIFSYDGKVYNYLRGNLLYNGQFGILDDISDLILIPSSSLKEVAVISGRVFEIWEYESKQKVFSFELDSKICSGVVNNDWLVLGTMQNIYLYNHILHKVLHQYKNDYGKPSSLFIMSDRIAYISLENENVQRCELFLETNEKPIVRDLTLFDCHWKESLPIYFVVNMESKIDIFYGHSTSLAGIDINDKIKSSAFSICGNYLILGTQTGKLCFYNYKTRQRREMAICNEDINLVRCFEDKVFTSFDGVHEMIVVASSKKVVLLQDTSRIELSIRNKLSTILYLCNNLIAIDVHGDLLLARSVKSPGSGWMASNHKNVVVAETHKERQLLAIGSVESNNYSLKICSLEEMEVVFDSTLDSEPRCLSFSQSGKFLSAGCKNGDIKVFNIENKLQDVMVLHKRSVERVLFAPNHESILVSLGDQIAWWNLESFQEKTDEVQLTKMNLDEISHQMVFTFDPWKYKKLHDTVPYLLTSTNLHGKQLQYISASKDFKSFLIVDIDGNIFKMEIINS